jgi:hypothetical protein
MSNMLLTMKAYLSLVALGIFAVVVRALTAPSEAPPRWDLLVCILVALAGAIGAFITLRRSKPSVTSADSGGRFWWPAQRSAWMGFGLFLVIVPVLLVVYATFSYSAEAWRITEAGHTIGEVKVHEVLSSERSRNQRTGNSTYSSEVEVSIPFATGSRDIAGKVFSDEPMRPGDEVWALYAPSTRSLGAILDTDRGTLEEKTGGPAGLPLILLVAGWTAWWLFLALVCGTVGSSLPGLKAGRVRALAVSVVRGGAARVHKSQEGQELGRPNPCLLLEGAGGVRLRLFMDRAVDPVSLAATVAGEAHLYWAPRPRSGPQGSARRQAVLVAPGNRYVRGWVDAAPGSVVPEGAPVPASKELPGGRELHAIRTLPVLNLAVHGVGFVALQVALLALMLMTLGVGPTGTALLASVAVFALPVAWMVTASRRTRDLAKLLVQDDPIGPSAGPN